MANLRKRIEALHEMFISEKLYIDDMILWESEFRKCILNFSFLSPKVKYEICDTVFINMHEIRLKHEEIFNEMKKRNLEVRKEMDPYFYVQDENAFCIDKSKYDDPSILKLEYATIFYKYMEFINFYERYFSRLPKAEYELERVCHYSPEFKQGLHNFLAQNKIEYLGVRNFLYRPSTKLSRLPLLLKAIFKNEGNDEFKAQYELLIDKLKQVTLKVDNLFKFYSGQFKIYRLSQSLQYVDGLQNPLALGLFQKKRALLKEGEFLIKSEIWASPIISKIYFFDHCILFCESSKGQFSTQKILLDPLFLERLLFFDINVGFNKLEGDEDKYFPLFLLETSENNLITILFEDFDVRKIYISILSDALLSIKKNYCTNLKLTKININLQNILSACQTSKFIFAEMSESMSDLESTSEQNENETDVDVITNEKLFKLKEFRCAVKEYTKKIEKHFLSSEPLFKSFTTFRSQNKILEEGSDDSDEGAIEQTSWIKKLCYGQETFSHVLNENLEDHTDDFEYIKNQEDMLIASTKNGIFKILGNDKKMIYQGITKKVLYDSQYEILMFQSGSTLCICNFNNTMNSIKPFSIKKILEIFFMEQTLEDHL
ncbi:hypothetical protein NCER_100599 [Vairimorpha ceranae BRL01]|uniref:DH domain-containing protein n=1 Tax=Vairimorpha ceranae (strain BRL01) TaxID=578460 RepID=C4V803_VAIC1|nr:hypothetical protein NCER_100599 [Vairimorpha ceranae BRL01]